MIGQSLFILAFLISLKGVLKGLFLSELCALSAASHCSEPLFGSKAEFPWTPAHTKWNICSPIGPDSDAITRGRWHVYCCLVCYCYSVHFRLPTSLLIRHWLNPRITMKAAWLVSCNLIWKGAEMIRCLTWSHLYLAVDRDWIFPLAPWGLPEVPFPQIYIHFLIVANTVYVYPAVSGRLGVGGLGCRRALERDWWWKELWESSETGNSGLTSCSGSGLGAFVANLFACF